VLRSIVMSRAFAIGMAITLGILGMSFLFLGYAWWFSSAFAMGLSFLWIAGQELFRIRHDASTLYVVLNLLFQLLFVCFACAGVVFIVPDLQIESLPLSGILVQTIIALFLGLSFFGYAKAKGKSTLLPFLRYLNWNCVLFVLLVVSLFWWDVKQDSYVSLGFYLVLLCFGFESVLRAGISLRKKWKRKQIKPEQMLENKGVQLFYSNANPISSIFDKLEDFFGIDINGTWAIHYIRKTIEPLCIMILMLTWITSSLVVVDTHEKAVRENFGVPEKQVLEAGLHVKWPWPFGRVQKVPAYRVLQMKIGHESTSMVEEQEEESILWANQHADEEFTLLLGDGRDLISTDGTLHYRITDVIAYLYSNQNPEETLRALTYRVLMHETASRTLEQALSENLIVLAQSVTNKITEEVVIANIGIEPVNFSFSALHPPVAVAEDYQQVISAQIDKETRVIRAETYKIQSISLAEKESYSEKSSAEQDSLLRTSEAIGEAKSFDSLRQTVRQDEQLYMFRRRQEALEKNLQGRDLVIIDHRLEKQGAQLWIQE
jgi:regulator of protease activity HflC (stomatin/prohibitin superfamily)